ncbi:PDZ domain-containing protein [Clostridium polynesiense]|uniref:PDZ domain-containing protein n=1 Tax=Clostridium polynesiense TaxID=1325933 RepID=UPI00058D7DF5|nr:PDZ domain-containing protein [Clostridium polynesiense]
MNVAIYTLRSVAYAIVEPSLLIVLIFLGIIFYNQNKKTSVMQKMIIGERLHSPLELTLSQIVIGILAGTMGSLLFSYLGIMFPENSGIEFLFLVSILLMLFRPRFFCFAYSGSILGLISIIVSYFFKSYGMELPLNIDIVSLFSLVGVLHIIEGILVIIDGNKGAIPIFTTRENKIIGGFALKRYWALPVAIFIMYAGKENMTGGLISVNTPGWWPILKGGSVELLKNMVLAMIPFYGVLGYSGITFTKNKTMKALHSGVGIIIFGVLLTAVAQLGRLGILGQLTAVVFSSAGHEIMLYIQKKLEEKSNPKYVSDDEGIMVLEVAPQSPAYKAGIKSGDKLILINGKEIASEASIYTMLKESLNQVIVKVKDYKGNLKDIPLSRRGSERLGLVLVPRFIPKEEQIIKFDNEKFKDIIDKFKGDNKN